MTKFDEEIKAKGEELCKLKKKKNKIEAREEELKEWFRTVAKAKKLNKLYDDRLGKVSASDWSKDVVDVGDYHEMLLSLDREEDFFQTVSVLVGQAKKTMPETHWKKISRTMKKSYHVISVKLATK